MYSEIGDERRYKGRERRRKDIDIIWIERKIDNEVDREMGRWQDRQIDRLTGR